MGKRKRAMPTVGQLDMFQLSTSNIFSKKSEPYSEYPHEKLLRELCSHTDFEISANDTNCLLADYFISGYGIRELAIEARSYILRALAMAKNGNAMFILPMALGKTYLAVLLMARQTADPRKSLYLAPTKILAEENSRRIAYLLPDQKVALIHGSTSQKKRLQLWSESKIICMTPQTLEKAIEKNSQIGNLREVGFVHFDEIHKFQGKYSYVVSAEYYKKYQKFYEFLGEHCSEPTYYTYTGTVGAGFEDTRFILKSLQIPFERVFARTRTSPDVLPYVFDKHLEFIGLSFVLPEITQEIRRAYLDDLNRVAKRFLDGLPECFHDVVKYDQKKQKYTGMRGVMIKEVDEYLHREAKDSNLKENYEKITDLWYIDRLNKILDKIRNGGLSALRDTIIRNEKERRTKEKPSINLLTFLDSASTKNAIRILWENGIWHSKDPLPPGVIVQGERKSNWIIDLHNPKFAAIVDIANRHEFHRKEAKKKMIIFVDDKDHIPKLRYFLQTTFPELSIGVLVGSGGEKKKMRMSKNKQVQAVADFADGKIQILIATSIGMEGIDFPSVDLVIFMVPFAYVELLSQGAGRVGRHSVGWAYILYYHDNKNEFLAQKKIKASLKAMDEIVKYFEDLNK